MAFPQDVLGTKVEIWYDQGWNDITSDVRGIGAEDGEITIGSRGQPDETTSLSVTEAELSVNNRDGKYSPRNLVSPLYGKIGLNTPLRIITDVADTSNVEDDFSTDGTNGWPVADSGHVWTPSGGVAADYLTTGGVAIQRHTAVDTGHECYLSSLEITDFDIEIQGITMEALPTGAHVVVYLRARISNGGADFVQAVLTFFPSQSLIIRIDSSVDGVVTSYNGPLLQPDSDETVSLRFRAVGRDLYARGWRTSDVEPSEWDAATTTEVITPGSVMLGSNLDPSVTNTLPFDVSYQGIASNLGIILFTGEVAEWPKRWDKTGNDVWVPLTASGLTRRLSQGEKPIGSPLFRHYTRQADMVGYWSFENLEGASDAYPQLASDLDGGAALVSHNIYPGGDAVVKWSGESTLLGSDPLPNVELGASTFGAMQYGQCRFLPSSVDNDSFSIEFWNYVPLRDDIADAVGSVNLVIDVANGNPVTTYQFLVQQVTSASVQAATISMYAYTADLTLIASVVDAPFTYSQSWRHFHMAVTDTAGTATMRAYVDGVAIDFDTWANTSIGQPSEFNNIVGLSVAVTATGVTNAIGHLGVASGEGGNDLLTYLDETVSIGHDAYSGELATDRLTRLFAEEGITFELVQETSLTDPDPGTQLGYQKSAPFMELVQSAARADDGVLYEMREDFGYRYKTRWYLYGSPVALELDYSNADLSEVPEATHDDQRIRNKIRVKRDGGSGSVTVEQTTGPLSTNDPRAAIPGAGLYDVEYTANLFSDEQRADYAAWRKYLGTWDEDRFPGVSVVLHRTQFFGDRTKMASAALLDIAEILTIINPPVWLPPDNVVLQVRSVKIFLSNFNWGIDWACLPGRPWQEVATATAEYGRADTASSVLVSTVDDNDTEIAVFTEETDFPHSDPQWTENISELNILGAEGIDFRLNPQTLKGGLGGERVRAVKNEVVRDGFTRSGQLSGSNAETGQTWVSTFGTAADATTDGSRAVLAHPSSNSVLIQTITGSSPDVCVEFDLSFNFSTATGGAFYAAIVIRSIDFSNYYSVFLEMQTGLADPVLYVQKTVAGVQTNLLTQRITAQTLYRFKIEFNNRDILVKQWDPSSTVEGDWTYTLRGAASQILTGNDVAFRTTRVTANTNVNATAYFDNFKMTTGRVQPYAYDRFARTVANGLGSADVGGAWTNTSSGGVVAASDWQVTPNQASVTLTAAGNVRGGYLTNIGLQDMFISLQWTAPLATGATLVPLLGVRRNPATGGIIYGYIDINTSNTLTAVIGSTSNGQIANTVVRGVTHSASQAIKTKLGVIGNVVMMKVWPATDNEPTYWTLTGTCADPIISGDVLWRAARTVGNTNVNPAITFADFKIENPQKITVQRGMDGVSRSWEAGTDVRLWTPARAGR